MLNFLVSVMPRKDRKVKRTLFHKFFNRCLWIAGLVKNQFSFCLGKSRKGRKDWVNKSCTLSIHYKGHLYKGQLVKIMTFTKQFIRDASLEAFSLNLTVSLIKDTGCNLTRIFIFCPYRFECRVSRNSLRE